MFRIGREEHQPHVFPGIGAKHDRFRQLRVCSVPVASTYSTPIARPSVSVRILRHSTIGAQIEIAGRQRFRNPGQSGCHLSPSTIRNRYPRPSRGRRIAVVRLGVVANRDRVRMIAQPLRSHPQRGCPGETVGSAERIPLAPPEKRIAIIARDPDFPVEPREIRLQIVVRNRPVRDRATRGDDLLTPSLGDVRARIRNCSGGTSQPRRRSGSPIRRHCSSSDQASRSDPASGHLRCDASAAPRP